ncbi:MAG: DUF7006 family protein [Vagococcus fluvialis]
MYLWDYSLDEVKKMTTSDEMLAYYGELQIEANKIIKVCSQNNLKEQTAKLNIVNVQLELCHFYMNISELLNEDITDEEIISIIKKDYKKYFYESMDVDSFWRKTLLGCQIDQTDFSEFIWNMDVIEIVETYFENSLSDNCIDLLNSV